LLNAKSNISLVLRNWLLGKRISEEELKGEDRAEYGLEVVKRLSDSLTEKYGKGFSKRTIYKFLQFYKAFPEIVPTVSAQSGERVKPQQTQMYQGLLRFFGCVLL